MGSGMHSKQQRGFTIIELMFATVVFSSVLLLSLAALVQIGKMYYKGVTTAQTQQSARSLLDELSQSIQFSGANIEAPRNMTGGAPPQGPDIAAGSGATGFFCVGTTRYTYALDRQQSDDNDTSKKHILHALWADEPGVCAGITNANVANYFSTYPVDLTSAVPSTYNGRDLLSDNMRLTRFAVDSLVDKSIWQVRLTVVYGEDDLLTIDSDNPSRRICKGATVGTEFCAVSELSTIIKRRISVQ
jgi:prepilin-type N-terminal cleavage/methylation domain-containing protein